MRHPDARVLLFAKAPVPGRAKTRLIPALGAAGAAALAARLLEDTLERLAPAALAPITLCCAPDTSHPLFARLAVRYAVALRPQRGADLGERMHEATAAALDEAHAAVLIGSDCPGLDAGCLDAALAGLATHDAVLGPATDGGYVLLGLRRAAPARLAEVFRDLPWGGPRVAALTRERLRGLDWRWLELPVLPDLDRPEDLALLDGRAPAAPADPGA